MTYKINDMQVSWHTTLMIYSCYDIQQSQLTTATTYNTHAIQLSWHTTVMPYNCQDIYNTHNIQLPRHTPPMTFDCHDMQHSCHTTVMPYNIHDTQLSWHTTTCLTWMWQFISAEFSEASSSFLKNACLQTNHWVRHESLFLMGNHSRGGQKKRFVATRDKVNIETFTGNIRVRSCTKVTGAKQFLCVATH